MIIEPCEARYSVLAESIFLRGLLFKNEDVVVAEYAAGREYCDELAKMRRIRSNNNNVSSLTEEEMISSQMKVKSKRIFQEFGKLKDYYIRFCDYPCNAERHPFHVILMDCVLDEDCEVQRFASPENSTATMTSNVTTTATTSSSLQQQQHSNNHHNHNQNRNTNIEQQYFLLPSANDVFRSKGSIGSSVLFAFQHNNEDENNNNNIIIKKTSPLDLVISQ